jgi:hypothetical protein
MHIVLSEYFLSEYCSSENETSGKPMKAGKNLSDILHQRLLAVLAANPDAIGYVLSLQIPQPLIGSSSVVLGSNLDRAKRTGYTSGPLAHWSVVQSVHPSGPTR